MRRRKRSLFSLLGLFCYYTRSLLHSNGERDAEAEGQRRRFIQRKSDDEVDAGRDRASSSCFLQGLLNTILTKPIK